MFRLILLFLFSSISISQENIINSSYFEGFEIGNLGSPFSSYFPNLQKNNLEIKSDFMDNHLVENYKKYRLFDKIFFFSHSNIKNSLTYISGYNEGGFISSQLTRPVSNHSHINFYYNNLISNGFFQFQENRFSNLGFEYAYFNENKPYGFIFHFNSINSFHEENGGVEDYNQNLSDDLQQTYFSEANSEIKNRNFSLQQYYKFNSGKMISYLIDYNRYRKVFTDNAPSSYHYSYTPLFFAIVDNYQNTSSFYHVKNKLTLHSNYFLEKNIDFSFIYNLYYHDLITNNLGDFIFSISNFKNPLDYKYKFDLNFCPIGHNKNNYDLKLMYELKTSKFNGEYLLGLNKQKPNLFSGIYPPNLLTNLSWEDDIYSLKNIYISFDNSITNRKIDLNFNYRKVHNLLYYNHYALYTQLESPVDYLHFLLQKKWVHKKLDINQAIHLQKRYFDNDDNSNILSIPFFLYHQSIKYNFDLFKETQLIMNFDFKIHSNYFPNTYMPLSSIFYTQNDIQVGGVPFFSVGLYLQKNNFSLGVIFKDIQYTFLERNYITQDYIANPSLLNLYINWEFLD